MTMKSIPVIALIGAVIAMIGWDIAFERAQRESTAQPAITAAGPAQNAEGSRRLGPFSVSGNRYVVVLQEKPRSAGSTGESGNTVERMEIQNMAGSVEYERTFSSSSDNEGFSDAWFVSAESLTGKSGSGLMMTYVLDSEPSAPTPESSGWWQLFGVVNGKLTPFSGPIAVQGELLPQQSPSDSLEFKVWAHHFRLVFPVAVNWTEGKLSPALTCDACEYKVLPEDLSDRDDLTFVRMCPADEPRCEKPDRTVVKSDSTIELATARADVHWDEGLQSGPPADSKDSMADEGQVTVSDDVWLKIRIDGKEGWLHDAEDFEVLRLPFEQ